VTTGILLSQALLMGVASTVWQGIPASPRQSPAPPQQETRAEEPSAGAATLDFRAICPWGLDIDRIRLMAKRFSGSLQISVVYDDRNHYRATVAHAGEFLWRGIVTPP